MKTFADDKINVDEKFNFCLGRVENILKKKEEMLVTSIFSFSYNIFKTPLFCLGKVENIVGKGENGGYHRFLLFQLYFQNPFVSQLLKVWIV